MNKIIVTIIIVLIVLAFIHFFFNCNEPFKSEVPIKILIFVSKTCPYCADVIEDKYPKIIDEFKNDSSISVQLIMSGAENTSDLFKKYRIEHIPQCVVVKGENTQYLKTAITPNNLRILINTMQ